MFEDEDDDQDWGPDDDDLDESAEPDASDEAPAEPAASPDDQATGEGDALEQERQKLRSAEGRFKKFEESLEELRSNVAALEGGGDEGATDDDVSDTPALPEGWSETDWDDFVADNPVEAELIASQSQQLKALQEKVDNSEQIRLRDLYQQQFHDTVTRAHPDYTTLVTNERPAIEQFITEQSNPLVKKAYQHAYEAGSADDVVELVNQYKLSKGQKPINGDRSFEKSLAVPSSSSVPDSRRQGGLPDAGDEDAAWDYWSDDSI